MNQKEITTTLKIFSDDQLRKELELRRKKRRGKVLGYRANIRGDEMNYGTTDTFIIGEMRNCEILKTKELAKLRAEQSLKESHNRGHVEEVYKDNLEPSRVN